MAIKHKWGVFEDGISPSSGRFEYGWWWLCVYVCVYVCVCVCLWLNLLTMTTVLQKRKIHVFIHPPQPAAPDPFLSIPSTNAIWEADQFHFWFDWNQLIWHVLTLWTHLFGMTQQGPFADEVSWCCNTAGLTHLFFAKEVHRATHVPKPLGRDPVQESKNRSRIAIRNPS